MSTACDTKVQTQGLDHTSGMSEEEHRKFVNAFRDFKAKTGFESEVDVFKLKYYVQMAYLNGWKAKVDISKK